MLLTPNNIKAELSYAYLHAVASRAGMECTVAGRHSDGAGVDAVLRARERFDPASKFVFFPLDVQLKATSGKPAVDGGGRFSFVLELDHYNKLRDTGNSTQTLLVVLFLPLDDTQWLGHSEEGLTARRCAYWVSLRGAPASDNTTSQTIYIPRANVFSPATLRSIMTQVSVREFIPYEL